MRRLRQRRHPVREQAVRLDLRWILVRLERIPQRRLEGERPRNVEQSEPGRVVESRSTDVRGRSPHQLEELRVVEFRPLAPDPRRRSRDNGGGEARPVGECVARGVPRKRLRDRNADARRGEVGGGGERREAGHVARLVRRADREHVCVGGREVLRAAVETVVAGGRDDERARAEREEDGLLQKRIVVLAAEAEVDHSGAAARSFDDALDRRALVEDAEGARVPDVQEGLRVDADGADAVVGCGDDGRDLGAVVLVLVARGLRVEDSRVRAARELGMAHVDSRVDDRDGFARARRLDAVGADRGPPPLLRDERVGRRLGLRGALDHPVRPDQPDDSGRAESGEGGGRHAPDPELVGELGPTGAPGQPCPLLCMGPVQLDEVVGPGWPGARQHRSEQNQKPGRQGGERVQAALGSRRGPRLRRSRLESR